MKITALLVVFAFFCVDNLVAQTFPPCPAGSVTTSEDCQSACIVCNFNGFSSTTIGSTPSNVPNFCGSVENDQWLAVIAPAETMIFTITPSNCTNGNGMQLALYADCGGQYVACAQGCSGCADAPQTMYATGLTPGETYLLLIDGWAGDQCDFTVSVSPSGGGSSTAVLNLDGPAVVCPNETAIYSVDPSLTTGNWTINGATSYEISPGGNSVEVVWPQSGSGQVIFGDDCAGSGNISVQISEPPVAGFSTLPAAAAASQPLIVCKGQPVFFENTSLAATSYEWFFGDFSQKSLETSPSHSYGAPGDYQVLLLAENQAGCPDTFSLPIKVLPDNGPALDCNGTVCRGEEVTYSTSNACNNFEWTVVGGLVLNGGGPGDPSATILWNGGPDGSISLTGLDCSPDLCPLPTVFEIPIIADDAEIQGDSRICEAEETAYEITAFGGSNYVWALSSGGQIVSGQGSPRIFVKWTATPNVNATHWLSVTYDNCYLHCGGQDSLAVRILPKFKITGPLEACEKTATSFSGLTVPQNQLIALDWKVFDKDKLPVWSGPNSNKAKVTWGFGPGQFQIIGYAANPLLSCTDEASLTIQVYGKPAPLAGISGDTIICKNNPILYEAEGISPAHAVFWKAVGGSWTTKIGDQVPISWSSAFSTYQIGAWQRAPGGPGCHSDTTFLDIKPMGTPVITGPLTVCVGTTGKFSMDMPPYLTGTWETIPPINTQIVKGQGEATAEILFTKQGVFTVLGNRCGSVSAFTVTVVPNPKPAVLHPDSLCIGSTTTVSTTQPFASYSWRKENGAVVSTAQTASLGPGFYLLKVTNQNGCEGDTLFEMEPLPVPEVAISTPGLLIAGTGNSIEIIATTTTEGLDYQWFKDSIDLNWNSPILPTTSGGVYWCIVTDVRGCTAQSNILSPDWLQLAGGPPAPPNGCPNVGFTASATATCNTRHYEAQLAPGWTAVNWYFSNGQTASGPSVDVIHPIAGYFQMIMIASYPNAECGVLDFDHVLVAAKFDAPPECATDATKFRDLTTFLPGESIVEWAWNFDDPGSGGSNISNEKDPEHLFSTLGIHQVSLVVTAASGCTSVFSKAVGIPPPPSVQILTPAVGCAKTAIEFIGATTAVNVASWEWKIKTGIPAQPTVTLETNPAYYLYGVTTAFSSLVELKMTTIKGCEVKTSMNLEVGHNPLNGAMTVDPPSGTICLGQVAKLTAPPGGTSWAWSGPGSAAILTTDQALTTGFSGLYTVTVTNATGCTLEDQQLISTLPAPIGVIKFVDFDTLGNAIGLFASPVDLCEGENVLLIGQGVETNYSWSWSNGNSGTSNPLDSIHGNLPPPGNHVFNVTLTASNGCTALTPPFALNIHPNPTAVTIESSPNGFLCGNNGEVTFSVKNPDFNLTYKWNTGQPGAFFQTEEAGKFFAVATTAYGCTARSNTLEIRPGAPVFAVPAGCHQKCATDTICLQPPPGVVAWQWFFNDSPIAAPLGQVLNLPVAESGNYTLLLTDQEGCTALAGPVSVDLLEPFGNVLGEVFADVNLNGILDAADTLLAGIPVLLKDGPLVVSNSLSGVYGDFSFENIVSKNWTIALDSANLPAGWQPIIGSATVVLQGCDAENAGSLLLQFCQPTTGKISFATCPGQPVFYENQWLAAGSQTPFFLTNGAGCDSILTVEILEFQASGMGQVELQTCEGDSLFFQIDWIQAGSSETFTAQDLNGCDSLFVVHVVAIPSSKKEIGLAACTGQTVNFQGVALAVGVVDTFFFKNSAGCDSLVVVKVDELSSSEKKIGLAACTGKTVDFQGVALPAGAIDTFFFKNSVGCDSLVVVEVAELLPTAGSLKLRVCEGNTILFQGIELAGGAVQNFPFVNSVGCDSTLEVTVEEWPVPQPGFFQLKACAGESVVFQNQVLAAGSTTHFFIPNSAGCDSLVVVSVEVLQPSATSLVLQACSGETIDFQGVPLKIGDSKDFFFENAIGCDSTLTVSVEALPALQFDLETTASCFNQPTGGLELTGITGVQPLEFSIDGGQNWQASPVFEELADGQISISTRDGNGCILKKPAEIPQISPLFIQLENLVAPCDSPAVFRPLVSGGDGQPVFSWKNAAGELLGNFQNWKTDEPGRFLFEVKNACEMRSQAVEMAWDEAEIGPIFYTPNVFAPESNHNFEWCFLLNNRVQVVDFQLLVFDRWGNQLFETTRPDGCWDGSFRGKPMNPGVFVWWAKFTAIVCGERRDFFEKGDVTLVR